MPDRGNSAQSPLLELLLENSPLAVIEWTSTDYRIVRWAGEATRVFGWTAEEVLGRRIDELAWIHPGDREQVERVMAEMLSEGAARVVSRNRNVRKDGRVIHCEWHNSVLRGAGGFSVLSLVLDDTERRRAEQALQESEARARRQAAELQAVLDTVPAAVWITRDPRGEHIDGNRHGAELLRRPRGANLSVAASGGGGFQRFEVLMDGQRVPPEALPIQAAARRGTDLRGVETEVHFEDGTVRYLLGNATPLLDEQGRPAGSVGAFIDITERKLAERELREADRRRRELQAMLSHELRNPLAPIRNAIHLLEEAPPGGEVAARALGVLRRQADHLARLVDDLLDLSRLTHGKAALRPARLDARQVVRLACADAQGPYQARGVALSTAEAPEPLWIDADPVRLAQAVGNLLANALKFTPPGGRVRVATARRGEGCEIEVSDTGAGIDAADLDRIFQPFVQAERTAGSTAGMGLGLAVVQELATRMGGAVRAESPGPERGARFTVTLPLRAPPPAAPAAAAAPHPRAPPLSVLVVEDGPDAAATLADLLALRGHRAVTAGTGRAGVAAALAGPPDVLICDVGLPDMSGHDVVRAVRAAPGGDRVFAMALTGYAQPSDRDAALAAGFDAHLAKPLSLEDLDAHLARAAARRAAATAGP